MRDMEKEKSFRTIEKRVELLESRDMRMDEDPRPTLMREGYYSVVNGYKDILIDRDATARVVAEMRVSTDGGFVSPVGGGIYVGQPFTGYGLLALPEGSVIVRMHIRPEVLFRSFLPAVSTSDRLLRFFIDPERDRFSCGHLLLSSTTLPVEDVSRMVGYADTSNFYKAFRATFGMSLRGSHGCACHVHRRDRGGLLT
jgi:AraC-like DNA-binding protein